MNSGRSLNSVRKALIGVIVLVFGATVWPTPWRWVLINDSGTVIRINRLTGTFLIINISEDKTSEELTDEPDDDEQIDSAPASSPDMLRISTCPHLAASTGQKLDGRRR